MSKDLGKALCVKCLIEIDKNAPFPCFAKELDWSKVGEFVLCDNCIEEILTNWLYAHVNNEGQLI
jgi:hypothetical protein